MKLQNKKTGEIGIAHQTDNGIEVVIKEAMWSKVYHSLAELNEEWEDYEEPKMTGWYYINELLNVIEYVGNGLPCRIQEDVYNAKAVGNYFETEEEAEKAVEKLKAWKRLKDKGFRINSYDFDYLLYAHRDGTPVVKVICDFDCRTEESKNDLDLLFSGEDN